MQDATAEEIERGNECLSRWSVVREYEVLVSGYSVSHSYLDRKGEQESVPFGELIFWDGECIGICHAECVFLFADEKTHFQKKYLGEFITGPDRTRDVYDHYVLKKSE